MDHAIHPDLLRRVAQELPKMSRSAFYREDPSYHKVKRVIEDLDDRTKQYVNETKIVSVSNNYSSNE